MAHIMQHLTHEHIPVQVSLEQIIGHREVGVVEIIGNVQTQGAELAALQQHTAQQCRFYNLYRSQARRSDTSHGRLEDLLCMMQGSKTIWVVEQDMM